MIAVISRVNKASVIADGVPAGKVGKGLMIFLGVGSTDTDRDATVLAEKISKLRIFEDENEKMNLSVCDVGGGALVVSNFTLLADYSHGNRPNYMNAAPPAEADRLYSLFSDTLRSIIPGGVENGVFGADMQVDVCCDGPVNIVMDSNILKK